MKILTLKVRILVLWIFTAVSVTAESAFTMYEHGVIDMITSGEIGIGPGILVFFVLIWLVPFVMAFLTVNLRDRANRFTNMVLGAIFVAFNIFHFIMHAAEQELFPFIIIMIIATTAAAALILWYAIRWPKYEG